MSTMHAHELQDFIYYNLWNGEVVSNSQQLSGEVFEFPYGPKGENEDDKINNEDIILL